MEQSEDSDPCAFRKVVDDEVTPIVCVDIDDLVMATTNKETFDAFYTQILEEFPTNGKGDLSGVLWVYVRT